MDEAINDGDGGAKYKESSDEVGGTRIIYYKFCLLATSSIQVLV